MIYGCLTICLMPIIAIGLVATGHDDLLIGSALAWIATVLATAKLAEWRHRRAIRSEGALRGITNMRIVGCREFVNPGDLPRYVGWSCYDVEADDPAGLRRRHRAFLTWTWFGFRGIEVGLSTAEDYECYDANGRRIYPSSLIEKSEKRNT